MKRNRANHLVERIDKIARTLRVDTRNIREKLIREPEFLFEMANKQAVDCHPKSWKWKQNWARMTAYISQVINSVSSTYEMNEINDQVSALKKIQDSQFDITKSLSDTPNEKEYDNDLTEEASGAGTKTTPPSAQL